MRTSSNSNGAVFNLQWTDLQGRDGYYTGETDESGEPHGMGSMRYLDNGSVMEGEWYHGELERRMSHGQGQGGGGGGGDGGRSVTSNRSGGANHRNVGRGGGRDTRGVPVGH
mmetsp:Transcript_4491/g.8335  ORF Transcript_4491/g.8335 Transcript_4491/m.8335 type:complete len:112 (-) Transcript_4491:125-460(-)